MPPIFTTAHEVSEYLLDCTGTAMMAGDFDKFSRCFALPYELHTFQGQQVLETRDQLSEVFQRVRAFYQREHVTDIVRHCMTAEYRDEMTITAVHESRLVDGDRMVKDPYAVLSIIENQGGYWKLVRSDYAVEDPPALVAAISAKCQGPTT